MINAQFVPIEKWPGTPKKNYERKRAVFRSSYAKRLDLLEKELYNLDANNIIIQVYLDRSDIRNDGWPKSRARPMSPGVIVTFTKPGGDTLSFPCDTYDGWEDNLYAIALSLEALRSVDRYGVTQNAEQYAGWKRLAAPAEEHSKSKLWAREQLARMADVAIHSLADGAGIDLAYKAAARKTHPDHGGNPQAFQLLQDVMRVLRS